MFVLVWGFWRWSKKEQGPGSNRQGMVWTEKELQRSHFPTVTTEIMNSKAVVPQRNNKHKHCFGSSCSMSWAICSSAYASRLFFNSPTKSSLWSMSWKNCPFPKAEFLIPTLCVDSVVRGGRADSTSQKMPNQIFLSFLLDKELRLASIFINWSLHIFSHRHF